MHDRKQYSHDDRQHETQCHVIINKLGHEQSAEQRSEQTETHRDRQREVLEHLQAAFHPVAYESGSEYDSVGHYSHRYRGIDIGDRCRKRYRHPFGRICLYSEQLKQCPEEYVQTGAEDVSSDKSRFVRTVCPRHIGEELDHLLYYRLKFARYIFKPRYHKYSYYDGRKQEHGCDYISRYQCRIHRPPEERDPVFIMQYSVFHHLLDAFLMPG